MTRPEIRRFCFALLALSILLGALGCHGDDRSPTAPQGDAISLLDLSPSATTFLPRGTTVHVQAHLRCMLGAGSGGHVTANAFSPENGPVQLTPSLPTADLSGGGGDATLSFDLAVPAQQGGTILLTFGLFRQGQTDTGTTSTVLYQVP